MPAGDDAEHAAMPLGRVIDQRRGGGIGAVVFAEIAHLRFDLLPSGILLMKLTRQIAGAGGVRRQEKLYRGLRAVHAAGGIEAGRDAESDLAGGGRGGAGETRHIEERAQARIANIAQTGEAEGDDGAVLAGERNHVRHGGDGRQLEERFRQAAQLRLQASPAA